MALNMSIIVTSGVGAVDVPEDIAKDLADAFDALKKLPSNRAVVVDFEDVAGARDFVRMGKTWAATQTPETEGGEILFVRKGDIKGEPKRVTFRIYEKTPKAAE